DETEDGLVDYPMDGGADGDDDDGDSSGVDADDEDDDNEDEEEQKGEHLAPADSVVVIPTDELDDILETEMPPHKRLCLSALGSMYEVGESFTARPIGGQGIDYGFVSTLDAEANDEGLERLGMVLGILG
nr:hypothetical protein [Tanacetum cinerariifolium]